MGNRKNRAKACHGRRSIGKACGREGPPSAKRFAENQAAASAGRETAYYSSGRSGLGGLRAGGP